MKRIYFVRHGETVLNEKGLHQVATTPLSETGRNQARAVGKRLENVKFDLILSSNFERAIETANIINGFKKVKIEFTPLLTEIKRPTEVEGRPIDDIQVVAIKNLLVEKADNPSFHYSDEETFSNFKIRCREALEYIEKRQEDHILVVSHADTIRVILGFMMFGDINGAQFNAIKHTLISNNTGISLCEKRSDKWKIVTWNEISHL